MLDVTVKTLDGTNRSFSVPDDITVKEFKEKIAGSINIAADTQRLIYQGRVLQDEKKLDEYDVNGKTIHAVARPPPSSRINTTSTPGGTTTSQASDGRRETRTLVGSFTLPGDVVDPNQIQNIVSQVLSGMGDVGRNATISARSGGDGSSVDIHINLGQIGAQVQSESQNRIRIAQRMIRIARQALDRLENPPENETDGNEPMDATPSEDASPDRERSVSPDDPNTEATPPSQPSPDSETTAAPATGTAPTEGGAMGNGTAPTGANGQARNQPRVEPNPRIPVLADILQEVLELNQRLQPHTERYQQFLRDDPTLEANSTEARAMARLSFRVAEVMHCISHAYHSLSDVMVDTNQAPPRVLRAPPVAMPAAIIQQAIPVQAQISVAQVSPRASPQLPRRSATATGATATGTATSASSTTTTSGQHPPQMRWPGGFGPRIPLPPGAQIHMGGPPRMAGAAAFGPNGQPLMFMEVGPQGIAFNSISAQVVTASNSATTNTTATSGSTPSSQPSPTTGGMTAPQLQPGAGIPGLPPNFLQNIMQMAQQTAGSAMGGQQVFMFTQPGPMPQAHTAASTAQAGGASSTSTVSSTSTQSSTQSGQASSAPRTGGAPQPPHMAQPGQQRMPGFMFPGPRPGVRPGGVDPYLPCPSRFFMRRRVAAAANDPTNLGAALGGHMQEQDLGGMISNLVSSTLGGLPGVIPQTTVANTTTTFSNQPAGTAGQAPPSVPVNPFAALFNPAAFGVPPTPSAATNAPPPAGPQPATSTAANLGGPDPPSILQLRNLLQGSSAATSQPASTSQSQTTSSSTTTQSGTRTAGTQPMGDEMFAQMVRGIGTYVSQAAAGQQTSDSIQDFIQALGQETAPNEGLLSDIFACVSQHLTIVDLMAVLCEQTASLQRLILPLQEFVRTRVLQGEAESDENLDGATDRLVEEMLPQIEEICTDAAVKDNIDFPASVQELVRHHLRTNSQLLLAARENDPNFGRELFNNVRQLIHEFLVLSRCSLEGGQQAIHGMVQANIRRISSDVNPMIQQWMSSMTLQQLQSTMQTMRVTEDHIQRYVVRRAERDRTTQGSPQSLSSDASFMSAESGDKPTENGAVGGEASQDVPSCEEMESPASSQTMEVDAVVPSPSRDRTDRRPLIDPTILQCLPPPPQWGREPAVVIQPESWHSQVPSDWVPVITNDIRTQRQQSAQPPFSDAYINGMPAKRRKLMSKGGSEGAELNDMTVLIPQAIETAAKSAGAEPVTSPEDMMKDASTSATLRGAFQQEMDDVIRQRLDVDPDYIPQKYPNVEKYYKKKE